MIFIAAISMTLIAISCLIYSPFYGVLATLLVKTFIDASWDKYFMGVNCIMVISVAVPLLLLPRIVFADSQRFFEMQLSKVAVAYLASTVLGIVGLVDVGKFYLAVDYSFRTLSGFLGFFMFQYYVPDKERFRKLLSCLLMAGIFPILVGIYQAVTGITWRIEMTSMGMERNVGMYHDAFTIRYLGFQTLTSILLYWSYFCQRRFWMKVILLIYAVLTSFVIFKVYSKTGILIFVTWLFIWSIFTKKLNWFILIAIAAIGLSIAVGERIINDIERVYMKEIGVYEGTMEQKYILAGRTIIWNELWEDWREKETFYKLFGSGSNPPAHNEYLRVLICNGLIGVIVFIFLLIVIGFKIGLNLLRERNPLNIVALMVFSMFIVDTIGLHPGQYPAYQWYIYGFITLALSGVEGLDTDDEQLYLIETV